MPGHFRRLFASLMVLAVCWWVLGSAPVQDNSLQVSRNLQEESLSLIAAGRDAEALPLVKQLHEAYPGNHVYLARLAEIHQRSGEWQGCVDAWEAYLKVSPTPWEAFPVLGDAYR